MRLHADRRAWRNHTVPERINDRGQIVGYYLDNASNPHGFIYFDGTYTSFDVPLPGGSSSSQGWGINNYGQIVGGYNVSSIGFIATPVGPATLYLDLGGLATSVGTLFGTGIVTNSGSSAATLTIGLDNASKTFSGVIQDGAGATALTKAGTGTQTLSGINTYTGVTTIASGTLALTGAGSIANSSEVLANSVFDISGVSGAGTAIQSLSGTGSVALGSKTLTLSNASGNFAGSIGGPGGFALTAGKETLSGLNAYSGATNISGGTLEVTGSIASSSLTTVTSGGTLTGTGTVGNTTVAAGGIFVPGNGTPGSSMTVAGNLAFQSGALYLVQVNPSTSSFANVTGAANLNGAAGAAFVSGNYIVKQYKILTAAGGVSGGFSSFDTLGIPAGFTASLGYDAQNVFLNLTLGYTPPTAMNVNQQNVANALVNFFNRTGGIPAVFGTLTSAGLTQLSGEVATGSQQTTFDAMTLFMGLLTDPFIAGRGDPVSFGLGATPFAAEDEALAYTANGKPRSKSERDAYAAIYRKAPPPAADPFAQHWSVWAAGYGGSQTTDGNAVLGSNNTRSSIGGVAVGADYRFSPYTIAGFAVAGGGTNFSVNGLGSGRSDLFQAGAFVRHNVGAAYLTGALAYGWQDITTDRTVTAAGTDLLRARFNANAFSGRVEGGYRFVTPWRGWA